MKRKFGIAALAMIASTCGWAHDCQCTCKCAEPQSQAGQEPAPRTPREWGVYTGGSLTYASFSDWSFAEADGDDGSFTGASSDDSDAGFRIHFGMNLLPHVDIELGYADYGEASFSADSSGGGSFWSAGPVRESVAAAGMDLTLVGRLQVTPDLVLNGRAGVMKSEGDSALSGNIQSFGPVDIRESSDDASPLFGAGLDYDGLRPLRLSLSHTRVELDVGGTVPSRDAVLATTALTLSYLFQQAAGGPALPGAR